MDEETVHGCYFVLAVYRIIDLCCDWYCWSHFKNPRNEGIMLATCVFGTLFNVRYLYRTMLTYRNLQSQDIGRINSASTILPELNFHLIEVIVNVLQTALAGIILSSRKYCVDSMNYRFACCCCCGSILQLLCFSKNLCGYHGREIQHYYNIIMDFLGLLASFLGVFAYLSFADKFSGLPPC